MSKRRLGLEQLDPRLLLHSASLVGEIEVGVPTGAATYTSTEAAGAQVIVDGSLSPELTALHHEHSDDTPLPHPDDPQKRGEHLALLALVPTDEATHHAVQSGSWSDAATWGGAVPTDLSRVHIPQGLTVTIDGEADAHWIRVDGTLDVAVDRSTTLRVDTLVVAPEGLYRNLSQSDSRTIFTDNGPIDTVHDPYMLSRGLISHGAVEIVGKEVTPYVRLAIDPKAGDTVLQLDSVPIGWNVGDQLVLPGQDPRNVQDDVVTIASIDGTTVSLAAPLRFSHPTLAFDMVPIVANLSRNIRFESANPDVISRRGHVMFMHSKNVHVSGAGFYDLGRTDKSRVVTDPDGKGGGLDNPRARYAVHFHRTGTLADGAPATISDSVVWGSPGIGFVNHSSYVDMSENVSFDALGSGFFTEVGDETGSFRNNLAIRSAGSGDEANDGVRLKARLAAEDFGHDGYGFWMQGGGVAVEGNLAVGHAAAAFRFSTIPLREGDGVAARFLSANLRDPSIAGGAETVAVNQVPLLFRNNSAFASGNGLIVDSSEPLAESYIDNATFVAMSGGYQQGAGVNLLTPSPRNITFRDLRVADSQRGVRGFNASDITYVNPTVINSEVYGIFVGGSVRTKGGGYTKIEGGYFANNGGGSIWIADVNEPRMRIIEITGMTFGPGGRYDIYLENHTEGSKGQNSFDVRTREEVLFETGAIGSSRTTIRWDGQRVYQQQYAADYDITKIASLSDELKAYGTSKVLYDATGEALGGAIPLVDFKRLARLRGVISDQELEFLPT